jgi:hypothetical protein
MALMAKAVRLCAKPSVAGTHVLLNAWTASMLKGWVMSLPVVRKHMVCTVRKAVAILSNHTVKMHTQNAQTAAKK